jgi:uncharacterized protein YydD (DUF2326 family)
MAQLSSDRASLLNLLKGHGALEELTALQEMHATTRTHFEALTNCARWQSGLIK